MRSATASRPSDTQGAAPRLRLVATCCWLLLAVACSDSSPAPAITPTVPASATPPPGPPALPPPTPTPRPLPGARFPPDQTRNLQDLIAETTRLRGLEPKDALEMRLIGRQEAADYLVTTLEEDDRKAIALRQEVYRLLGLVPDDADLLQLQISLLRGLVLGFYDQDVKALFVLQDLGLNSLITRTTVVHEVVHALQDQYYDLGVIDEALRDDWDGSMAFTDLVEGDARGVDAAYMLPSSAESEAQACDNSAFAVNTRSEIPIVIQRELQAPYSDGRCFIFKVRSRLPKGVDSIYEKLPASTEQVLHPEKYLEGEAPKAVSLLPLAERLGAGWKQAGSSNLGEFGLQNLLLLGGDRETVKRGAAGWGGDRWALYVRDDGARLIHVATTWDSEAEAREFWDVFLRSLNSRSGGRVRADSSAATVIWDQGGGKTLRASISGDSVTVVVSTDAAALQAAVQALGLG